MIRKINSTKIWKTRILCAFLLLAFTAGFFYPGLKVNAAAACARQYSVVAGDSLSIIALANKVSVSELVAANNLKDPYVIYVGQVLCIPGAATAGTSSSSSSSNSSKAAKLSATLDENLLQIKASNMTKKSVFYVKVRSINGRSLGSWYKLGLLHMGKNTSREASYRLPRSLQAKASLEVCLKNAITDDLYCTVLAR